MGKDKAFIDLKTAASITGKSYSTMRNVISEMSDIEKAKHLKTKGKRIWIDKEFLGSKYPILDVSDDKTTNELLSMLKMSMQQNKAQLEHYRQLEDFDKKIETLDRVQRLISEGFPHDYIMKLLKMNKVDFTKFLEIGKKDN
ncbi:MAG: hypothetical protein ACPGXL_03500 [Chitinophagales bacterium]